MEKIQAMKHAAAHVDRILAERIPQWIQKEISEQALFDRLCEAICSGGAYGLSFDPIVAFGPGGAEPHHTPTNRLLTAGDTVLIDCGAVFGGWCSDCTRMFSLGEPSLRFSEKFTKLLSIHERILQKFVPGASCSELDREVRSELGEDASFFIHTLGHGVGAEVHVPPRIGKDSLEVLQRGDSVTCEPGLYFSGEFGIRIEDQLVIQENRFPEIITMSPRQLGIIDAWGRIIYRS
jgi:Xaa-Pro dipeptidase